MLNQCQFIGHLGADPEIRHTKAGKPVASFNIACTEKWKSRETGQPQEKTTWVPVVIFSEGLCRVAENYLRKGSKVFIQGNFSVRSWENQEGVKQWKSEIVLQNFGSTLVMLDGKQEGSSAPRNEPTPQQENLDDEVPW